MKLTNICLHVSVLLQMSSQSRKHLPQLCVSSSNIEDIMSRAYDSFDVQLESLQFLYSKPGTHTHTQHICNTLKGFD